MTSNSSEFLTSKRSIHEELRTRCIETRERMASKLANADKKIRTQWEMIDSLEEGKRDLIIQRQSMHEFTNDKISHTVGGFSAFNTLKIIQSEIHELERRNAKLDAAISVAGSNLSHKRKIMHETQKYRSIMMKEQGKANLLSEKTRRISETFTNTNQKTDKLEAQILILLQSQHAVQEIQNPLVNTMSATHALIDELTKKFSALHEAKDGSLSAELIDKIATQLQKIRQNTLEQSKHCKDLQLYKEDIKEVLKDLESTKKKKVHAVQYKNRIFGEEDHLSLKDKVTLCEIILARIFSESYARSIEDIANKYKNYISNNLALFNECLDLKIAVKHLEGDVLSCKKEMEEYPEKLKAQIQVETSKLKQITDITNDKRKHSQELEKQSDKMGEELEYTKSLVLQLCVMAECEENGEKCLDSSRLISDEDLIHYLSILKRRTKTIFMHWRQKSSGDHKVLMPPREVEQANTRAIPCDQSSKK